MAVYSATGSKFEVGDAMALSAVDLGAAAFVDALEDAIEVGEPQTLGAPSDEVQTEDFANVTTGRVIVVPVMRKGKSFELVCGLDPNDVGQLAMRAIVGVGNHAMRLTMADKPVAGGSPKNSTRLFVGMVTGCDDDVSGKIAVVKFTIQPNSNIVATHASAT